MDRENNQCIDKNVVNVTCDFVKCSNPFKQRQETVSIPRKYLPKSPKKCAVPDDCVGLTDDDIRKLVKQKADSKVHWNSDFADEMEIISKKYSNNYRIDLRSYFETRELIWSFKSVEHFEVEAWQKSGNEHSQIPGAHPEIWSVNVPSPPPKFKTKTIKISLEPKSAYIEKCFNCYFVVKKGNCDKCKNIGYLKHFAVIVIHYSTTKTSKTSSPKKFSFANHEMIRESNQHFRKIFTESDEQVSIIDGFNSKFVNSASKKLVLDSLKSGKTAKLLFQEQILYEACVAEVLWKSKNKRKFWVVVHEDMDKSSVKFSQPKSNPFHSIGKFFA